MQDLSKLAVLCLFWCTFLSFFGKNYRQEKDTPGIGQLWYVDLLIAVNQNFVKWIWGWTMVVITPFSIIFAYKVQHLQNIACSRNYRLKRKQKFKLEYHKLLHPISRIIFVGTLVWYTFTKLKGFLFANTGRCLIENSSRAVLQASDPRSCRWLTLEEPLGARGYWSGFNLSGHSFMLNFSFMMAATELYAFYKIVRGTEGNSVESRQIAGATTPMTGLAAVQNYLNSSPKNCSKSFKLLKLYFIVCQLFLFLCFICVSMTYLVYHTFLEKILGTILALFCWQMVYFDFCKKIKVYCPFLVGEPADVKDLIE